MLEAAARDVRYEVRHLFRAHAIHAQIRDEDERHLILEGLLIHFQNNAGFFLRRAERLRGYPCGGFPARI